jgi:CheY-like chemotaxis protein
MIPPAFHIWIIDDRPENIAMIEASFAAEVRQASQIRSFGQAQVALATWADLLTVQPNLLPDVILLDFFLDRTYGHHVLDQLLAGYRRTGRTPAVIIAHSSMAEANALLIKHGADFSLPKIKGREHSAAVAQAFRSLDALRWLVANRQPMPALDEER